MKRPFLPLVLALITGILFAFYFQITTIFVSMLLVLLICIFIYGIVFEKNIKYSLLLLFLTLGIMVTLANKTDLSEYLNERNDCIAIVDEIISSNSPNGKYIVKLEKINNKTSPTEKIVLNVISKADLNLGDLIAFQGVLKEPMQNTNPKLYNYKLNLLSEKIYATMTVKDYQIRTIKNENKFKYRIKDTFVKDVETLFNRYLNEENSQLMTSILLGKSSYLDEDNLLLYRDLGLAHIMAVSGLHIGIISGFLIFLFSRLGIKRRLNITLSLAIIWTYGFLIGYPPSIMRASIMFSLLFYSTIIHEPYDSINTLSIACFILLLINPYFLFNIGFQLSFVAAFSIVFFTPYIKEMFYPYKGKVTNTIAALLAVNLGLLPIQAYYFNRIGLFSILANLILLPLFSIALILGFIMLGSLYILGYLNIVIGPILNLLLRLQYRLIEIIPSQVFKVYSPELPTIILYYLLLMLILKVITIENLKKSILNVITIYLIFLIMINSILVFSDKSIELHFIDVGQGDSILIRTKDGDYLMDTGGSPMESAFDISKNITLPYLEKLGISRLKAIFITHFHADHCQGLPLLVENIKVDNIVASYIPKDNDLPIIIVKQGDQIILDKNTKFTIIWPDKAKSNNENNMSLVGLLSYYNRQVLLTGDIEKEVEPLIGDKLNKSIDVLKVPHHGSKTSSTEIFLEKLKPTIGIISVGRNNLHSHPSPEVVWRYNDYGSTLYRTDENGLIKLTFNKEVLNISTYIKNDKLDFPDIIRQNIIMIYLIVLYCLLFYLWIKIYIKNDKEMIRIGLQ